MKRYFEQEYENSCGATALRNVMMAFGLVRSEQYYRKLCKTTDKGTSAKNMVRAAQELGYTTKYINTKSFKRFWSVLVRGLKAGSKFIMLVDAELHWVAVLQYYNQKIKIVDTDFKVAGKGIAPERTMTQIIKMANVYDKINDRKYFCLIEISKEERS